MGEDAGPGVVGGKANDSRIGTGGMDAIIGVISLLETGFDAIFCWRKARRSKVWGWPEAIWKEMFRVAVRASPHKRNFCPPRNQNFCLTRACDFGPNRASSHNLGVS